jgi:hypothetical protein
VLETQAYVLVKTAQAQGELVKLASSAELRSSVVRSKIGTEAKLAFALEKCGSAFLSGLKMIQADKALKGVGGKVIDGAAIGAGAGIPIAALGAYAAGSAEDKAETLGNKALTAGLGVSAAALAAAHMMRKRRGEEDKDGEKNGSAKAAPVLEKIAAVGSLNYKLKGVIANSDNDELRKEAHKMLIVGNAKLATLVAQIVD